MEPHECLLLLTDGDFRVRSSFFDATPAECRPAAFPLPLFLSYPVIHHHHCLIGSFAVAVSFRPPSTVVGV
ncbi:hypothetical protein V9T40_000181 [Parthenolecanium corni]|uniref:Uncharacterized protein n=1 Tax=Parthenolecanium corni TaxID=536013 RepID=A0AAN9Y082_9HEMI